MQKQSLCTNVIDSHIEHRKCDFSCGARRHNADVLQFLLFLMCESITLVYKLRFYSNICSFLYNTIY